MRAETALTPVTGSLIPAVAIPSLSVPGASLEAYISAVYAVPMLTVEEEQALARATATSEDLDAARAPGDVAPALRGARRPRLHRLRPAASPT